MERIKQAIEQAREERHVLRGVSGGALLGPSSRHDPADISYTRTRSVTVDPKALKRNRVLTGDQDDRVAPHYKVLRTRVLQQMAANEWQTLAITSPGAGDGKTLTSVNLAVSIARELAHTVLLADLDLRQSSIHRCFDFEPQADLADYLQGDIALEDVLVNPGLERLVVLPGAREPTAHSSELLTSPKMLRLFKELKKRYQSRLLVFDLPPLLGSDDALAFLPNVDAVLLVIQDRKTTEEELTRSAELLRGLPILGTVLNKGEERPEYAY